MMVGTCQQQRSQYRGRKQTSSGAFRGLKNGHHLFHRIPRIFLPKLSRSRSPGSAGHPLSTSLRTIPWWMARWTLMTIRLSLRNDSPPLLQTCRKPPLLWPRTMTPARPSVQAESRSGPNRNTSPYGEECRAVDVRYCFFCITPPYHRVSTYTHSQPLDRFPFTYPRISFQYIP